MNLKMLKLSEAKVGKTYVVVKIYGKGLMKRRLMDLGIMTKAKLKVVGVAPLGDPLNIEVNGFNIAIRRNEASQVIVKEIEEK